MKIDTIPIKTEFIRLDSLLKLGGYAETGGQAKWIIQEGQIRVNGSVCTQRGKKLRPGDTAELDEIRITISGGQANP